MPQRSSYAAVFALTASAALVAACLSSAGLAAWADALPDSQAARLASTGAHALDDAMARLGVNRPTAAIQAATRQAEDRQ